jgi:type VI secretion system protein ImpD
MATPVDIDEATPREDAAQRPGRAEAKHSAADPGPKKPPLDRTLAAVLLAELDLDTLRWLAPQGSVAVVAALDRRVAEIDELMSAQVNAILHHPRFQRLESAWRGLAYLVERLEACENVKLRALSVTWAELARDFERAIEFDQSQLFRKIYSDEYGMPGGEPYGLLLGDFYVQHRRPERSAPDDVAVLRGLAGVAAAAFAPTVLGAAPGLLGLDSFRDLTPTLDLPGRFQQREYSRWRSLQDEDDARFLGLIAPPILMRQPLRDLPRRDGFRFVEDTSASDGSGYLWGNPALAFASVVMRAFDETGWLADIRGTRPGELGGGLVTDLPQVDFATDAPGVALRSPVQIAIPDRQERALSDLGLIPLALSQYTPYAIFYGNQSLLRPKSYDNWVTQTNARMSAMLHYMLCVSRFAHFLKVLGRDMVGSTISADDCETRLQTWLADYTMAPTGGQNDAALLAAYPLSEGEVQVREKPGKPGAYQCTVHLRPHYQLDEVASTFKLTTELAPSGTG